MTVAIRKISESSQVAARPIAWGNDVARPDRATPCKASFHQLYSGIPSRSIAGATSCICDTFSSSVIRATRSALRTPKGRPGGPDDARREGVADAGRRTGDRAAGDPGVQLVE